MTFARTWGPARWPSWLPRGGSLPDAAWRSRHRAVMTLLWAHVVLVPAYAVFQGNSLLHSWLDTTPVVVAAIVAGLARLGPAVSSSVAATGLMVCSAMAVHLSGGLVEAHFHFFVMIPVIALYESWAPFGLAVAYVLLHHGVIGTLRPHAVFSTSAAYEHPWLFAGVHAAFFAFACIACVVNWWLHERARLAAQAQTQLLSTIVDSLAEGLVVVDEEGGVLLRNPAGLALLGRTPREAVGPVPVEELGLFHPDGRPVELEELPHAQALAGLPIRDLDLVVRNDGVPDGRVLNFSAIPLVLADGDSRAVVVVFRDMTERHRTEQALAAALATEHDALERLRELERVKADFVSTVSHELRTPITSIIGYLEVLADGEVGELDDAQRTLVARVDRNSHRLLGLVEDLLKLSQIESSSLTVALTPTDLRAVVSASYDAVGWLLEGRRLDVVVDLPDAPVKVEGDRAELERMLANLLSNAVKFTPDGGRVEVGLRAGGTTATLVVADTGMGIPESEQEQLFTRFFRSRAAVEQAIQGTGLGLSIVGEIVTLHGGTVEVESQVGRGTRVTVSLRRTAAAAAA